MQVHSLQSQNFTSKQKFLTKRQLIDLKEITAKMNNEAVYSSEDNHYINKITTSLVSDNVILSNSLIYRKQPLPDNVLDSAQTELKIGKSIIKIDNKTGEIISVKKGLFKSAKKLMQKMNFYLSRFNQNYYAEAYVKRNRFVRHGVIDESDGKDFITKEIKIQA